MNLLFWSKRRFRTVNAVVYFGVHILTVIMIFRVEATRNSLELAAALYLIRMFGITGGYHRYFAHRSYKTSRGFQFLLALMGAFAAQKGVLWWASQHRHHHRHADSPSDPHSPLEHGFLWAHMGWFLSNDHQETDQNAVGDLVKFPELRWLDRFHIIPPILLAVGTYMVFGLPGLVWGFGISTVCCWHATYLINSVAHVFGTRRFNTPDGSRNSMVLALLTMGEGWHNNHHRCPGSARQGLSAWEIDLTYYVLVVLNYFGVVWDLRSFPKSLCQAQSDVPRSENPFSNKARCWVENGLLHVTFLPGVVLNLRDATNITEACEQLIGAAPKPAIVDFRDAGGIAFGARRYFLRNPRHLATYTAVAVLTRTRIGRVFAEIVFGLLRPGRPARCFTSEADAHEWLLVNGSEIGMARGCKESR